MRLCTQHTRRSMCTYIYLYVYVACKFGIPFFVHHFWQLRRRWLGSFLFSTVVTYKLLSALDLFEFPAQYTIHDTATLCSIQALGSISLLLRYLTGSLHIISTFIVIIVTACAEMDGLTKPCSTVQRSLICLLSYQYIILAIPEVRKIYVKFFPKIILQPYKRLIKQ